MGNPKAFLTIPRQEAGYRPVNDRLHDYGEVEQTLNNSDRRTGFSLHGLWRAILPLGMSDWQQTTRMARHALPRALE